MSLNKNCDVRVIAIGHSDQDHYYELLIGSMVEIIADLHANRARVDTLSDACISSLRDHHGFDVYDEKLVKIMQECMSMPPARWPSTKQIVPNTAQFAPLSVKKHAASHA